MADKWVAQGRKFCQFCNCWYADNKISIDNHEKGATHQANVEKSLKNTRRTQQDFETAERLMLLEMQKIEAAAMKSFEEDARRNSFARDEMDRVVQAKARSSGYRKDP